MKKPWYLKTGWVFVFCTLTPPIGYLTILTNLKKFNNKDKEQFEQKIFYLAIATSAMAFWVLKFTPSIVQKVVLCGLLAIFIGRKLKRMFKK
ncbi:hypothetical protein [Priestia endophytica]|uniref:hypothetical protein n=1 Tax=Priestia endophytica TaxID=135735 RepID=UPI0018CE3755|nr:hypothetical protein [Priestia endophytica]